MAAVKTFYPTFHQQCHALNRLLADRGPAMVLRTGMTGANDANGIAFTTTLNNLQAALTEILTAWPPYQELP